MCFSDIKQTKTNTNIQRVTYFDAELSPFIPFPTFPTRVVAGVQVIVVVAVVFSELTRFPFLFAFSPSAHRIFAENRNPSFLDFYFCNKCKLDNVLNENKGSIWKKNGLRKRE
jgi:hypothetical protein